MGGRGSTSRAGISEGRSYEDRRATARMTGDYSDFTDEELIGMHSRTRQGSTGGTRNRIEDQLIRRGYRATSEGWRREPDKEQVRATLASLKAPKSSRDSTTLKVGNREVVISKGTPGWTSSSWYDKPDLRRSRYTVRTTIDGAFGNTEFFDGPGGWKKAKAYAASHLGLGR